MEGVYGRRGQRVGVAPTRPSTIPGPETMLWFWNPNNLSVRFGPSDFRARLKAIDRDLEVTWSPVHEQWCVWARRPRIQSSLCRGWALLFSVPPRALDERVFARLFSASADRWGSGREYFRAVQRELEREKEASIKRTTQESVDRAMPFYDHSQISISMYGPSNGSKFSTYHS